MSGFVNIEVESDLNKLDLGLDDLRPVMRAFHAYMVGQIDRQFEQAGAGAMTGATARGIYWAPYSARYMGRKRPSGTRVSASSRLLQDTGELRRRAATEVVDVERDGLTFGTRLKYAGAQNQKRPFLVITDEDADKAVAMVGEQITKTLGADREASD